MWRLLLGTMGVKSLVQGLNAAATAGFEPRTVWSEVWRRNRLATAPPTFWQPFCVGKNNGGHKARLRENDNCLRKTTFTRLSQDGEVVRSADRAVMVRCPRHLREQSPFFARAKKAQNITENRDTAPLNLQSILHVNVRGAAEVILQERERRKRSNYNGNGALQHLPLLFWEFVGLDLKVRQNLKKKRLFGLAARNRLSLSLPLSFSSSSDFLSFSIQKWNFTCSFQVFLFSRFRRVVTLIVTLLSSPLLKSRIMSSRTARGRVYAAVGLSSQVRLGQLEAV